MLDRDLLKVYAVTDRRWLNGRTLREAVEEALKGGVTFVQLREKNLKREELLKEAFEIKELCGRYKVPFVINDNPDIAAECGADGVHVGQNDMAAEAARKRLGPERIIGVSVRTVEQAVAAEKSGADYLGVGAVFSTGSKADAKHVSMDTVREICSAVSIPVIAIGGVNEGNVTLLKGTGICGVAIISALFAAGDITEAAEGLAEKVDEML